MRLPEQQLGPWPEGKDDFHRGTHVVFQPAEERRARLTEASNVALDDEGWPRLRAGKTQQVVLGSGTDGVSFRDWLIVQDGTQLLRIDPSDWSSTVLEAAAGTDRIEFCEHGNQLFWLSVSNRGRILADGSSVNWGCAVAPVPTLGTTAGSLRAGVYLVACIFVDAQGVEHAAPKAAAITLSTPAAITVGLSAIDSAAVSVKIFASEPNGSDLFYVSTVAVGSMPATITAVAVSEEPLRTQFLSPPLLADGLFSYQGLLMLFMDEYIFPSFGANQHLFEVTEYVESRPTSILAGVGLDEGFWTVCERGAFWTTGDVPENWKTRRRDNRRYAKGGLRISGSLLPALRITDPVALFVSQHGVVVGTPTGELIPLHQDQLKLTVTDKRASITYGELDDLRQVLFTLE